MNKRNKGVTLIALAVTIIVMLILAGITISALNGNNGIVTQAKNAKKMSEASSEREAISIIISSYQMNKQLDQDTEIIGKELYSKNFINSTKWNYIVTLNDKNVYGDNWYYIAKDTELSSWGKAKNEWLVNYETGEILELNEEYIELSAKDAIAITDGLIFNLDSNDISTSDKTTWGNGVELYGFENDENQDNTNGLYFDGIDDYVSFKMGDDYEKGFTFSFYGSTPQSIVFAKQRERNTQYSCRFGWNGGFFRFNTSKNIANSEWSIADINSVNNGIMQAPYKFEDECYLDLTYIPSQNTFMVYKDGEFLCKTIVDKSYWNGNEGGRQIFEDTYINSYIGRWYGGEGKWYYTKANIYNMKLYNRALSQEEIQNNYVKTIAYHSI